VRYARPERYLQAADVRSEIKQIGSTAQGRLAFTAGPPFQFAAIPSDFSPTFARSEPASRRSASNPGSDQCSDQFWIMHRALHWCGCEPIEFAKCQKPGTRSRSTATAGRRSRLIPTPEDRPQARPCHHCGSRRSRDRHPTDTGQTDAALIRWGILWCVNDDISALHGLIVKARPRPLASRV
jgi:hypothetical protein